MSNIYWLLLGISGLVHSLYGSSGIYVTLSNREVHSSFFLASPFLIGVSLNGSPIIVRCLLLSNDNMKFGALVFSFPVTDPV